MAQNNIQRGSIDITSRRYEQQLYNIVSKRHSTTPTTRATTSTVANALAAATAIATTSATTVDDKNPA